MIIFICVKKLKKIIKIWSYGLFPKKGKPFGEGLASFKAFSANTNFRNFGDFNFMYGFLYIDLI